MSTLDIILIALAVLIVLLAIGGMLANRRWRHDTRAGFESSLDEVNQQLAAAHAEDKGWEPAALGQAARREFAAQRASDEIREEALVAVIDNPGVADDHAVFRFVTDAGTFLLTLGRAGGEWSAEGIERAQS